MDIAKEFEDLLVAAKQELRGNLAELVTYTAERAAYLSTLVGQKGYQEAVLAERDAVALKAGILSVKTADAADARLIGMIHVILGLGAKALATA